MMFATPRLRAALWLSAVGVVGSLVAARPEPVAIAAPFAVLALIGLRERRAPQVEASLELEHERVHEGEHVQGVLELHSPTASDRLEARLLLPPGLALEESEGALALRAGEQHRADLAIACERWGAYAAGLLRVRRYDALRLVADEHELDIGPPLRVYPQRETLRALARPLHTQASVGDQVSRRRGEGIELAELRPYSEGDDLRRINWAATARTGDLVVNELHPERNTAVVLVLDTFAELGTRANPLDEAARATVALAQRYLTRRDRVGLLTLGGGVRWLRPASGAAQLHRIVDTVLSTRAVAPREDAPPIYIPQRVTPAQALVLVLSALFEDTIVKTVLDMRGRGFDVAVVEIPPLPYLQFRDEHSRLAARLIRLERDLLRAQLRARGIAVVEWKRETSLEATIRAMEEFRRRARVVHA
jgi:uncharacterized protein (DUF58 family)